MKTASSLGFLLIFFFFNKAKSQASFTLSPQACQNQNLPLSANSGTISPLGYTWTSIPNGAVFSNANSSLSTLSFNNFGTYTITLLVSSNSGTTVSSKTISVIPFPIKALSALSHTICAPQSATLNVTGANNYTWLPTNMLASIIGPSVVASPSISTVYTVTGTSSLCGTSSLNFSVAVHVWPILTYASSAYSVCYGQTATLSAFGALTYTWLSSTFSVGMTQPTIAVGPGMYSLVGSNGGSCTHTMMPAIMIYSAVCTGIEDSHTCDKAIRLFPNPCSEKLILQFEKLEITQLDIINLQGEIIYKEQRLFRDSEPTEIDVRSFPKGLYFLRVFSQNDRPQKLKFIKE